MPLILYAELRSTGTVPARIGVTVAAIVAVCEILPDCAVTVTVVLEGAVDFCAVSMSVLDPDVAGGLKDAVTPLGTPVAVNLTVPSKLPRGRMKTFALALRP